MAEFIPATQSAQDWDDDEVSTWSRPSAMAGGVALDILNHSAWYADAIREFLTLEIPETVAEDAHDFFYTMVTEAGRLGYLAAQLDFTPFEVERKGYVGGLRNEALARAVAALAMMPLVEDAPKAGVAEVAA